MKTNTRRIEAFSNARSLFAAARHSNKAALLTASALAFVLPMTSHAQEDVVTTESDAQQEELVQEKVIVTGSNIKRNNTNFSSSAPITQVGDQQIEGIASISVEDVLNRIPSITSELTPASNNISIGGFASNVGVATTSLRNLGSARTLVLVNGRRYVSGVSANSGYGVDLNSIPTSIIERVDVLTGGQSAIYGSDAVAGVVNIITKSDIEGAEFNGLFADSEAGGAGRQNLDFTYGKRFESGSAWISAGYANQEELLSPDRNFAANELRFVDADGDGIREAIAVRDGPAHVPGAALFVGNLAIFGDGTPFNTNQPLLDGSFNRIGATDFDNQHSGRYIVSPYERIYVASGLNFDLSDKSSADIELNYSQTTSSTELEPAPLSVIGNVFRVGAGGTTGIDVAASPYFVGSSAGAQLVAALGTDTSLDNVRTFRRLFEFGPRAVTNNRSTFRIAASHTYDFDNGYSLNSTAVYGITSQLQNNSGDISMPNTRNALRIEPDGNGGFRCADPVAVVEGCVPVNPFNTTDSLAGQAGIVGFSPAAIDYIQIDTGQTGEIKQSILSSVLSGELPWAITGNPIAFATGVEYRKEEATEIPDSFRQLGQSRDLPIAPIDGQFDVVDVFAEVDAPVADWLNLSAAVRLGDYSTSGSATTYRIGADAPINDFIRLRASQSRSVRAPNINDLFSAGTSSVAGTNTDVCNGVDASAAGNIAENCRSIPAIANRIATLGSFTLVSSEANNTELLQTGSLDLEAETADALTLGVVLTPSDALSASIDYYDISIDDGITRVTPDVFVARCYDVAPSDFDPTCGGTLIRDTNDGPILNLRSTLINAATIETSGVDVEVAYSRDNLNVNFFANFLNDYDVTGAAGSVEEFTGRPQYPEQRYTINASYDVIDPLTLFAQVRYRSETKAFLGMTDLSDDLNTLDAVFYADARANYRVNDFMSFYAGVNNLFDEQPDILPRGASAGTNTEPRAYDVIGRQFFLGFKWQH
jgi:outer membrane receptor protein involved in Fe transport